MSDNTPAVGDVGVVIMLATGISASAATCRILYRRPDGQSGFWPAVAYDEDGEFGVAYTTTPDDLSAAGAWLLQAQIETAETILTGAATSLLVRQRLHEVAE